MELSQSFRSFRPFRRPCSLPGPTIEAMAQAWRPYRIQDGLLATFQADLSVQDDLPAPLQADLSGQDALLATLQADLSVQVPHSDQSWVRNS